VKFILLHETKNEEGIKTFFLEVWEMYVKVSVVVAEEDDDDDDDE
jgi:hypothetical protein